MSKKKNKKEKPQINKALDGYEIGVNTFGEIKSNLNVEDINEFLNKELDDKKLRKDKNK
jgi:hypothetical protein